MIEMRVPMNSMPKKINRDSPLLQQMTKKFESPNGGQRNVTHPEVLWAAAVPSVRVLCGEELHMCMRVMSAEHSCSGGSSR